MGMRCLVIGDQSKCIAAEDSGVDADDIDSPLSDSKAPEADADGGSPDESPDLGAVTECVGDSDCKDPTKPICRANQCRPCMTDSECPADPSVCMSHKDGHCATPAETIVVQNNASCAETATGPDPIIGTTAMPVCSMEPLLQLIGADRRLVVVRGTVQASSNALPTTPGGEVSIIGQQDAVIAGGASPGLQIQSAAMYVRAVAFKLSTLAGIRAVRSTLRLDEVLVDNNSGGGIFLDATQFAIANSSITHNGPGLEGGTDVWGGVYVSNVLPTGPKLLQRVTIQANRGPGLICSGMITGTGVLATANSTLDVGPTCMLTSCPMPSPTCGAP